MNFGFTRAMRTAAIAGMAFIEYANAAELPDGKAALPSHVQTCPDLGLGYFRVAGTPTCIHVFGQVRADYYVRSNQGRGSDTTNFRYQARMTFDGRTLTDYGVLQSLIELQADGTGGNVNGGTMRLRRAFMQLGGFTAGYTWSPYSFYDQYYGTEFFTPSYGEKAWHNLISYKAQFGKAWATLSIEDSRDHRGAAQFGGSAPSSIIGGQVMPDLVGAAGYDDDVHGWGRFQIMGALHQNRSAGPEYGSTLGYSVGIAGNLNLPVLAGAYLVGEASYADGAVRYLNAGAADAFTDGLAPFDLKNGRGYVLQSKAVLNFTPAWQVMVFGGYLNFDAPSRSAIDDSFHSYVFGSQISYSIANNFMVGAECWYQNLNRESAGSPVNIVGGGLRVRRTF